MTYRGSLSTLVLLVLLYMLLVAACVGLLITARTDRPSTPRRTHPPAISEAVRV